MSFLTINSMISISVPGIGKIIMTSLLNFIYLDILQTDLWLFPLIFPPKTMQELDEEDDDDKPLNIYFDENGFGSKLLIKNLGSTFVYLVLYTFFLAVLSILKLIGKFIPL